MKVLIQVHILFMIFWEIQSTAYFVDNLLTCPQNMIAYSINENPTERVCDCKSQLLYYPQDDSCYDAYRQGPCPYKHYLVLLPGEAVARCVKNPCSVDGFVPYRGKCHILWANGKPCDDEYTYLGFNQNYQIECNKFKYHGDFEDLRISKFCTNNSHLISTSEDNTSYSCECNQRFLYLSKTDSCHMAYRQGPCSPGNYFVLPLGQNEPRCEKNPCHEDGLVPFEGGCHQVYKSGPHCPIPDLLTVDEITFQLQCTFETKSFGPLSAGGIINAPRKVCPLGSRRILTLCKKAFQ
ncbi:uncharacterized protein LOC127284964 [Leptopilina boulardi]|uniref:uncharacterized protein LOC127284964 n=1 Tax=Leptopilina boulardi TaxID=63433 RepID=UPI0021F65499|nr:uncharacterized protein LOC127284964 [Leptopilina boulardi]